LTGCLTSPRCSSMALLGAGLEYRKLERAALLDEVAEQISAGNVAGWFQGRMEWGPRALGNRSIVAHLGFARHEGRAQRPHQAS
jgi:predicted NodU family carbamoyl transferase